MQAQIQDNPNNANAYNNAKVDNAPINSQIAIISTLEFEYLNDK